MATRYSGNVTVRVVYRDGNMQFPNGYYDCHVSWPGGKKYVRVGPPAAGFGPRIAYDSPTAYDQTAQAAVTFVESSELPGDFQPDGGEWDASVSRKR